MEKGLDKLNSSAFSNYEEEAAAELFESFLEKLAYLYFMLCVKIEVISTEEQAFVVLMLKLD